MKTKKIILSILVLLSCLTGNAQNNLFDKYGDLHNVSSVYISKTMIEMNPNLYTKDVFIGKVAGQLDAVYIISTMDNSIKKDLRKDIDEFIQKGKYELLMKQKGVVSRSSFYVKTKRFRPSQRVNHDYRRSCHAQVCFAHRRPDTERYSKDHLLPIDSR